MNKLMTLARRRRVIPALRSGVDYSLGGLDPELVGGFADGYYSAGGARTTFADLFTFNRASTATYFDASGNLQTAAIGEARLDHDPATGSPLGLLVEPQRTNLVVRSTVLDASGWSASGATLTDLTGSYLGAFPGCRVASAGVVWHRAHQDVVTVVASGTVYAFTAYVLEGTSGRCRLTLRDITAGKETLVTGVFGALAVTQTTAGTVSNLVETDVGGGITKITGTFTPNFTGNCNFGIGPDSTTPGEDITALAVQIEEGDYPTSLIPTNGSTVTRVADDCSVALSKFGFNTSEGTVVVDFDAKSTGQVSLLTISNGATNNRLRVNSSSSGVLRSVVTSGGVTTYALNGASNLSDISKVAYGFKEQDYALYADGVSEITSSATGSMPSGLTTLQVGASSVGAEVMVGHIKLLRYFPTRLSDATLQEGST